MVSVLEQWLVMSKLGKMPFPAGFLYTAVFGLLSGITWWYRFGLKGFVLEIGNFSVANWLVGIAHCAHTIKYL